MKVAFAGFCAAAIVAAQVPMPALAATEAEQNEAVKAVVCGEGSADPAPLSLRIATYRLFNLKMQCTYRRLFLTRWTPVLVLVLALLVASCVCYRSI